MKKWRIYFTLDELRHIHSHVQSPPLKRFIQKRIHDIDQGYIQSFLEVEDNQAVKLGFLPKPDEGFFQKEQERRYLSNEMSPAEELDYEVSMGRDISKEGSNVTKI